MRFGVTSLSLLFVVSLISCNRPSATTGENLLTNTSFETLGQDGMPVGWWRHLTPEVVRDTTKAHSGRVAVKSTTAFFSQAVGVASGQTYTLGHYTRADARGQAARLQVNFGNNHGETLGVEIRVVPCGLDWAWNEMTVKAPRGATVAVIFLQSHEDGEAWFDDVWFGAGTKASPK